MSILTSGVSEVPMGTILIGAVAGFVTGVLLLVFWKE
jgi:hypothetical protein